MKFSRINESRLEIRLIKEGGGGGEQDFGAGVAILILLKKYRSV